MKKFFKDQRGFTLIELLVVISIMAVLIGVAVTGVADLSGSGSSQSKKFELNAVQTAIDAYNAVDVGVNGSTAISARGSAAVIASADTDSPFHKYLRQLPTKYTYSWGASGANIVQP